MTLLRRAPREVYRVYSEEEFFAVGEDALLAGSAASAGLCEAAVSAEAGERRLRRLAGAAALAGAMGAVGATFAVTGSRPARGARRTVADTDLGVTARAHVSTGTGASVHPRAGRSGLPARRSPAAAAAASRRASSEHRSAPHIGVVPWGRAKGARRYATFTPRAVPGLESPHPSAAAVDVTPMTGSPAAKASQPRAAEFGFER